MNIIELLASKKLSYHYNFGGDKINNYEIKDIIDSITIIKNYYQHIDFKVKDIDSYVDCSFIQYLNNIQDLDLKLFTGEYNKKLTEIKNVINKINSEYKIKDIILFIKNNYTDIFEYYSKEEFPNNRDGIKIHIRVEIRKYTILKIATHFNFDNTQSIIVDYLINNQTILFFDNINSFKNYHSLFINKLSNNTLIHEILTYRYINLLSFLENNIDIFKKVKTYDLIIDILISNVQNTNKHIYQREIECKNLICFLKLIRDVKVRKLQSIHSELVKAVNKEVIKHGHKFEQSFNLEKLTIQYKKMLGNRGISDFNKLIAPHILNKNDRVYLNIENIDEIDIGLSSVLFGEDSYYASVRIMCVEQILINSFNKILFNLTIRNIGYRRLEKLIVDIIYNIFFILKIEYKEDEIKNDVKGIIYSIKNCYKKYYSKSERNYNYYIHSSYIIVYMEKVLRKLYVSINENESYIKDDKITLGDILEETSNDKLILLVGKNLFKWIKFFILSTEKNNSKFDDKLGYDYRNKMCHYRDVLATNDTSAQIYYIVIYLFVNLIIALHLNIYNYPSEETENIIIEQFKKLKNE